jgi:hypothetical protein
MQQRSVSLRFILARRTLVETISCITLYHSALIATVVQTSCRFFHTLVHCVFGNMVSIFMSFIPVRAWPSFLVVDTCVVAVLLSSLLFSHVGYMPCPGYTLVCISVFLGVSNSSRFSCSLVSCHLRSHSAVIVFSFRLCVYMRHSSKALHFASMCVISHPPILFGR